MPNKEEGEKLHGLKINLKRLHCGQSGQNIQVNRALCRVLNITDMSGQSGAMVPVRGNLNSYHRVIVFASH